MTSPDDSFRYEITPHFPFLRKQIILEKVHFLFVLYLVHVFETQNLGQLLLCSIVGAKIGQEQRRINAHGRNEDVLLLAARSLAAVKHCFKQI